MDPITPRRYRPIEALGAPSLAALPQTRPVRVAVWNLQYCGGRASAFWYDGGSRVHVSRADHDRALSGVIATLQALDADVLLLQEVDRGSRRTGYRDQLMELLAALPGYAAVSTPVHRNRFVPSPWPPLGRVNLYMATLCRAPLAAPLRIELPRPHEPRLRAHFNLHRALLAVDAPLAGGGTLRLGNTHLSAFTGGDDTLARQVDRCDRWLIQAGSHALLGGDFNLLPPGDDPSRLPSDGQHHPLNRATIDDVFARHASCLDPASLRGGERGTYLPPSLDRPDRTLDWLFLGAGLRCASARIEAVDPFLTDHWPIVAEVAEAS